MRTWTLEEIDEARRRTRPGYPDGHTVREFCEIVGCSPEAYYSWRRKGVVKPIRVIARSLEKYVDGDGAGDGAA